MIKISTMSGKLKGIPAINTNTVTNQFCQQMQKGNNICKQCYSQNMLTTFRKNCQTAFQNNSDLLSKQLVNPAIVPINARVMRLHGHGELINRIHFINYLMLARFHHRTTFVLWTKRKDLVNQVIKDSGEDKPKNLVLIYSNAKVDSVMDNPPKGFDKTFNVVTSESDKVNCRGKCTDCMLCYSENNQKTIVEVIK